ncbi:MAG TPA: hypothetical protein VFZ23_04130, partial [Pyrinomonadaceae bacterium]
NCVGGRMGLFIFPCILSGLCVKSLSFSLCVLSGLCVKFSSFHATPAKQNLNAKSPHTSDTPPEIAASTTFLDRQNGA